MGAIADTVKRLLPYGAKCQCPCGGGVTDATPVDVVVPGTCSNWGAYGIAGCLAALLDDPDILHDTKAEARMLRGCIDAGMADGISIPLSRRWMESRRMCTSPWSPCSTPSCGRQWLTPSRCSPCPDSAPGNQTICPSARDTARLLSPHTSATAPGNGTIDLIVRARPPAPAARTSPTSAIADGRIEADRAPRIAATRPEGDRRARPARHARRSSSRTFTSTRRSPPDRAPRERDQRRSRTRSPSCARSKRAYTVEDVAETGDGGHSRAGRPRRHPRPVVRRRGLDRRAPAPSRACSPRASAAGASPTSS